MAMQSSTAFAPPQLDVSCRTRTSNCTDGRIVVMLSIMFQLGVGKAADSCKVEKPDRTGLVPVGDAKPVKDMDEQHDAQAPEKWLDPESRGRPGADGGHRSAKLTEGNHKETHQQEHGTHSRIDAEAQEVVGDVYCARVRVCIWQPSTGFSC